MYEIGYAVGRGKPVIHICSTPLGKLPFDVAQINTIAYTRGRTHRLGELLASRIKATIGP
jgi:nucleoside 2-deoxyribosyltransferase